MSQKEVIKSDHKLFEASKLKLAALTNSGSECQNALTKIKQFTPILIEKHAKFVEFMFAPLWESKFFDKKGEKIFVLYAELLDKLISTDKSLQERTLKYFITLFLGDKRPDLKDEEQLTKTEQRLFPQIHQYLRSLCSRYSTIRSFYLDLILNSFLFTTICTIHSFVCYFSNCSSIYLYESDENREKVLWRLIERLINVNSYIQKSDEKLNRLFEVGLSNLFKFINKICLKGDFDSSSASTLNDLRLACNRSALIQLFNSLSSIFLAHVVKMDNPTSVNLVLLYVCSLDEELCDQLLNSLWIEAFEVVPQRAAAVNYFCSFLCAAKFLSLDILIGYMIKVSEKINSYLISNISIEDDLENFHKTLKRHKYFYSMCNCLFKLVCVRDDEYAEKHINQLSLLHVQKIITCSLNPLAVCPLDIVQKFAEICRFFQLGLCNMILQRNRRIGLYDLLKKRDVKFKLIYPFEALHSDYDKLSLFYKC